MNRSLYLKSVLGASCLLAPNVSAQTDLPTEKKNVLFIIVDDLRPELGVMGARYMKTPHLDALTQKGTLFQSAYCNIPVSGASRASLFSGLRPGEKRFWDVHARIDEDAPEVVTLPQLFRENGYKTISNSKVIHGKEDTSFRSWDEEWNPEGKSQTWRDYITEENLAVEKERKGPKAYEAASVDDDAYFDGKTVSKTIDDLKRLKKENTPFFVAVGILKPHLPFNAPKKYWDMYDRQDIRLPDSYTCSWGNYPKKASHAWNELRYYHNMPNKGAIPTEEAISLIHGYRACVSYADAQIGRLLAALEELKLDKNTTVVVVGDHGWSLGEHGLWCKHSNFEVANNTPLFLYDPEVHSKGEVNQVVELVDVYPTLCESVGIDQPKHLQGENLIPLMLNPQAEWKNSAVVKWHTGVTLIKPEYTYTLWTNPQGNVLDEMLFNRLEDPQELNNLAKNLQYKSVKRKLKTEMLQKRGY